MSNIVLKVKLMFPSSLSLLFSAVTLFCLSADLLRVLFFPIIPSHLYLSQFKIPQIHTVIVPQKQSAINISNSPCKTHINHYFAQSHFCFNRYLNLLFASVPPYNCTHTLKKLRLKCK